MRLTGTAEDGVVQSPRAVVNERLAYVVLAGAIAVNYWLLWPLMVTPGDDFDAVHLYLPLARHLMEQGLSFFATEESIMAPPFSYAWPALLGGDFWVLKVANTLLSGASIVAVFRIAWLLHSPMAGCAAACLFAASPVLRAHLASPMTEPLYIFLCAGWLWGHLEWTLRGRRAGLAGAAIAIALAALTRASIFWWVVILCAAALVAMWRARPNERRTPGRMLVAYALALALVLGLCVKNWVLFDFPFYTTGGGNALYLGNNPLTRGYDPNYLGLNFDVGTIAEGASHLTLKGERNLGAVARFELHDKDIGFLADLHVHKLAAFLFVTNAVPEAAEWRTWRVILMVLTCVWLAKGRGTTARLLIGSFIAYHVAIHVPVLYTHRYSVPSLDPWLVVGGALGIATLLEAWRAPRMVMVAAALLAGIVAGQEAVLLGRPMPDIFAVPNEPVWQSPAGQARSLPHDVGTLELAVVPVPQFRSWVNHVITIDASDVPGKGRCDALAISYRAVDRPDFTTPMVLPVSPVVSRYQMGTVPLGLEGPGVLRVEARCGAGSEISIQGVAIYAAFGAVKYHERLFAVQHASRH